MLARPAPRDTDLDWETLPPSSQDLQNLQEAFTESEVRLALDHLPGDKALGPNGFSTNFYKSCWPIIKVDIMAIFFSFHSLRTSHLHLLNTVNIALIPKKEGADKVQDYRPISLIHGIAKWIAKMLARWLAPCLNSLVSRLYISGIVCLHVVPKVIVSDHGP